MPELLQIPLRAGVDEGTGEKQLPPGTLLRAQDCFQDKNGRVRKRYGTTAIGSAAGSSGVRIVTRGRDLVIDDGSYLRAWDENSSTWKQIDRVQLLAATKRPHIDTTRTVSHVDCCIVGDKLFTIYRSGGSLTPATGLLEDAYIYLRVEDLSTGTVIYPATRIGLGMYPRILPHGSHISFIVASTTGVGTIQIAKLDVNTFAYSLQVTLDGGGTGVRMPYDATVAGDNLWIVYDTVNGVNRQVVGAYSSAYVAVGGAAAAGGTDNRHAYCIDATSGEQVHVTYAQGSTNVGTYIKTFNATTFAVVAGPTQITTDSSDYTFCARYSATEVLVGYSRYHATNPARLDTTIYNRTTHVETTTARRRTHSVWAQSKPWTTGGRWYCMVVCFQKFTAGVNAITPGPSSAVIEIQTSASSDRNPHIHAVTLETQTGWYNQGWIQPGIATSYYAGYLPKVSIDASGAMYLPVPYKTKEPVGYSPVTLGYYLYKITTRTGDQSRSVVFSDLAVSAGGAPAGFDGVSRTPIGFLVAPMIREIQGSIGAGSMVAGTYQYVAVYEWRDAAGNLHRSPPSPPRTVSIGGAPTGQATLEILLPGLSHKTREGDTVATVSTLESPVMIVIYRTTVNGSTFYRLTDEPNDGIIYNDETLANGYVTYVDQKADAHINHASQTFDVALSSKPQLYTDAGELDDVAPPCFTTHAVHRGRIFGIGPDERTVWVSKDFTEDETVFPGFNEALTLAFDEKKTALASLDERLAVFGENGIHIVEGKGPDAAGADRDWTIYRVQTDVGCVNPRSVVTTPMGIMFESHRGIELLSRGLEVAPIGEAIEDTLADYPNITAAVLVAEEKHVRFACQSTAGTSGRELVYDYARNAWYVWRRMSGVASIDGGFADAAVIDGVYTLLASTGQVYEEDQTDSLDGSTFVSMLIEFPLYPSGAAAWHRLKDFGLVGEVVTQHDLTVQIGIGATVEQQPTFQMTGATLETVKVTFKTQKRQMVVVTIYDATPTAGGATVGTGEGARFELISCHVQRKGGTPRLAEGKKR
jgi:hypothetical protein